MTKEERDDQMRLRTYSHACHSVLFQKKWKLERQKTQEEQKIDNLKDEVARLRETFPTVEMSALNADGEKIEKLNVLIEN